MTRTLTSVLREIERVPDRWVVVDNIRRTHQGLTLSLVVRKGKRGPCVRVWEIQCVGIRELQISNLNGGGIRLYSSSHPAAKQFTAPIGQLSCAPGREVTKALGAVAKAHVAAVDDWVPVDRYLPFGADSNGTLTVRAPDFLVRVYARALRKAGFGVRLSTPKSRTARKKARVLHLGNSFIVANSFEVESRLSS